MSIITLLTDNGLGDHYVAALKAKIISADPSMVVVDICHSIAPGDIGHGAFILAAVFRDFPKGTIHLVGIDSGGNLSENFLALQIEDHYFIGVDNGLFGLISESQHQHAVQLNSTVPFSTTFPERDVFVKAAIALATGADISTLGVNITSYKKLMSRTLRKTQRGLLGNVVRVDYYGNLITNITKEAFDTDRDGRPFVVTFGARKSDVIHQQYVKTEFEDCFLIFNSLGLLEIGMYRNHAGNLLGLDIDSPVIVTFS